MKNIDIAYADNNTMSAVKALRSNQKIYVRILEALDLLGFFERQVVAEIFNEDKRKGRTDICISDKNEDLFILTCRSLNKNDLNVIRKVGNDEDVSYDLSLIKKAELNNDNIDLCRTDTVYNTRHGRLISDRKNFVSLFLGGNVAYQLLSEFDKPIPIDRIVADINDIEEKPSFKQFISSFEKNLLPNQIDQIIEINAYNEFVKIGNVRVKNEEKGKQKKLK